MKSTLITSTFKYYYTHQNFVVIFVLAKSIVSNLISFIFVNWNFKFLVSFELIVVVVVFVMIFNITTKMQKKIEVDCMNSMIQKSFLYFIIEQNDISVRQNRVNIENVDEDSDDEFYIESIKRHEKNFQDQLNQFRQSIQNRINHYIFVYTASIFFTSIFNSLNRFSHRLKKLLEYLKTLMMTTFRRFIIIFFIMIFIMIFSIMIMYLYRFMMIRLKTRRKNRLKNMNLNVNLINTQMY